MELHSEFVPCRLKGVGQAVQVAQTTSKTRSVSPGLLIGHHEDRQVSRSGVLSDSARHLIAVYARGVAINDENALGFVH
jgi:hypothetical protein